MKMSSFNEYIGPAETLSEAKFNVNKMARVCDLLASLASKIGQGKFKFCEWEPWGIQDYTKPGGIVGSGRFYMNNQGEKIRFSYAKAKGFSKQMEINAIDYWAVNNFTLNEPTRSIMCYPHYNIVDVATAALQYAVKGQEALVTEDTIISEAKKGVNMKGKYAQYAKSKGLTDEDLARFENDYQMTKYMRKEGLWVDEEYKGFKKVSTREKNTAEVSVKSASKALKARKFADPEMVFDDIEKLATVVAKGHQNSLIVAGMAGIGKTFHVEKQLGKLLGPEGGNGKWIHIKGGKLTPYGLYDILHQYRDNKVIVFDDTDSVWQNTDSINMLKSALDTYDKRKLFWTSKATAAVGGWPADQQEEHNKKIDDINAGIDTENKKGTGGFELPSEFSFTSRVIFVSNLEPKKIDSAIRSRSLFMDIYLTRTDVVNRIKSIVAVTPKYNHLTAAEKNKIIDALAAGGGELTMRAVEAAVGCKSTGLSDWERLAKLYANSGE